MKKFEIRKILVPTDFSTTAGNAIRHAICLANLNGAKVKLLHVVSPVYVTGSELTVPYSKKLFDELHHRAAENLTRIGHIIKKTHGITIMSEIKMGSVEKVINHVASENFDMIIMGTHGASGVRELVIGSNAYKVVHNASCPVITVQRKMKPGFRNIILPIRLGLHSRQKVDYVVEMAKVFGSTVHVVGFTDYTSTSKRERLKQYVAQVERYLDDLDINFRSTVIFADNFSREILYYARMNNADLIAVMNNNDFSFERLIRGPHARQLVNHSDIPVFSVPLFENDQVDYMPYLSGQLPA